jgi:hypothetical protein
MPPLEGRRWLLKVASPCFFCFRFVRLAAVPNGFELGNSLVGCVRYRTRFQYAGLDPGWPLSARF